MLKIQKHSINILWVSVLCLVNLSLARNDKEDPFENLVKSILPDRRISLTNRQEVVRKMDSDGVLNLDTDKKACSSKLYCAGIGSFCVELVDPKSNYGSKKSSWCYCGSKNYSSNCGKRWRVGSTQDMKNQLNAKNIPNHRRNSSRRKLKKLQNEYLKGWRLDKRKKTVETEQETDVKISETLV